MSLLTLTMAAVFDPVKVEVERVHHAWYYNPFYLGIAVLLAIALIALIVGASRGQSGGGTTIVKT